MTKRTVLLGVVGAVVIELVLLQSPMTATSIGDAGFQPVELELAGPVELLNGVELVLQSAD
jgi:hypothetical protein